MNQIFPAISDSFFFGSEYLWFSMIKFNDYPNHLYQPILHQRFRHLPSL